jgi:two-component system, NarL family, nitrate/nitrite response regulator NarL
MRKRRVHSVLQWEDQRSGARRRRPEPSSGRSTRRLAGLTDRRRQVATLVSRGLSNRAIAQKLDVAEGTVKVHLHAIYEKLNIHSRTKLAIALIRSKSKAS